MPPSAVQGLGTPDSDVVLVFAGMILPADAAALGDGGGDDNVEIVVFFHCRRTLALAVFLLVPPSAMNRDLFALSPSAPSSLYPTQRD